MNPQEKYVLVEVEVDHPAALTGVPGEPPDAEVP